MKIKIDLDRDKYATPFGIATVRDRYLDETSPQHAFARAIKYISTYRGKTDWDMAKEYMTMQVRHGLVFLRLYFLMRKSKGLPISCFLIMYQIVEKD